MYSVGPCLSLSLFFRASTSRYLPSCMDLLLYVQDPLLECCVILFPCPTSVQHCEQNLGPGLSPYTLARESSGSRLASSLTRTHLVYWYAFSSHLIFLLYHCNGFTASPSYLWQRTCCVNLLSRCEVSMVPILRNAVMSWNNLDMSIVGCSRFYDQSLFDDEYMRPLR